MKHYITLIVLLCSGSVFSQILGEMQWEEVHTTVLPDNSFSGKGLLIVESRIPNLMFKSTNPIKKGAVYTKKDEPGVWYVKLEAGVNLIDIMAEGYLTLPDIRHNFKSRQAWKIKVTAKQLLGAYGGFDENRPQIILKYNPESDDEKVIGGIDGKIMNLDFSSGVRSFRPAAGKHIIKINSQGRIWEKSYDLESGESVEDVVSFSSEKIERWDLKEPGGLDISSDPDGATVFVNNVDQGMTPLIMDDILPGEYQIELVKDLYLAESRAVIVKTLEYTPLSVELTPNFGRLKIESNPSEAMVWINGQQKGLTPYEVPRYNVGIYALRIVQNLYHEKTDTFEIKPGGNFIEHYRLKPQFGKVTLTSEPSRAEVTVDGQLWGNTPLTRDKVLSGEHNFRLVFADHFNFEETIGISDDQHLEKTIKLRPRVGWLTVTSKPSGATVTIFETKKNIGQTPLRKASIEPGAYIIIIEKAGYEPYKTAIVLTYGGEQNVEANLERSVGHLRVSVEPRGTKIYLDDKYKGKTPMVVKDVPTGLHDLRLEKPGHDIQLDQVQVNRNEVTKYSLTLGTEGTEQWNKVRTKARLLSIVAPSSGQFVSKQYIRGGLYAGAFFGSLTMVLLAELEYSDAEKEQKYLMSEYGSAKDQATIDQYRSKVESSFDNMQSASDVAKMFTLIAGSVYIWQLIDAWIWGGGKRQIANTYTADYNLLPYVAIDENISKVGLTITWGDIE